MPIEVHRLEWRGRADGVALKTFMPRFPHHLPFHQGEPNVWSLALHLPDDARIEYRLEVRRGSSYESTLDPSNPTVATNPFGENSVLTGSAYPVDRPGPRSVTWRRVEFRVPSSAFGGRRQHGLLLPEGIPDREPLPLLLLHDGGDYHRHADIESTLGAAVASGRLPFFRVALLDPRRRNAEYVGDRRQADHVVKEVLPRLAAKVGIGSQRILGGASLGAVAGWHAAHTHPGAFSGLVLQSGTFAFGRHLELPPGMAAPIRAFLDDAMTDPRLDDVAVGQTCGRFESLIDWNRAVAGTLEGAAANHRYEERWTGHDWGAWSDTLVEAVAAAFRR